MCRRREGAAGLEDGTAHFLGIAALRHGYAVIRRAGGFPAVNAWASLLARCCPAEHSALTAPRSHPGNHPPVIKRRVQPSMVGSIWYGWSGMAC